jgi:D-glycero-D-manno-heptose 1,7-bisphosphate phosphatase
VAPPSASLPTAPLSTDGLWIAIAPHTWGTTLRPALFLDRDGVIVEEVGFLRRREDVRLIDGAATLIARANRIGLPVVVVTNQSAIGRGLCNWDDFGAVQRELEHRLAERAAYLDAVLACPYHREAKGAYAVPDHPARKPNPGLLLAAAARLPIDLRRSWIIGDRAADLAAGRNAGLAGGMHVATGFGSSSEERAAVKDLARGDFIVLAAASIAEAKDRLPLFREH